MTYFEDRGVRRLFAGTAVVAFAAGAALMFGLRSQRAEAQPRSPEVVAGATATAPTPVVPTLAPLVRRVADGVVNISVEGKVESSPVALPDDPFFRQFFNLPDHPVEQQYQAAGSGVIVDAAKGYVLTNNHVVDHADKITVTLADNRRFDAKVLGRDPEADIAVIQIPAKDLTALKPADSDKLQVGDYVVAIGNPFGLHSTVTAGIVSAVGRSGLDIEGYEDFIQTDASINPGNSGGALVDLQGDLVGINTAIAGPTGGNVGIGFAIPINMARAIMTQLIEHGKVVRGQLGVYVQDVAPDVATAMHLEQSGGALVSRVEPGSAADRAGIRAGDVILRVNDTGVGSAAALRNQLGLMPVGADLRLGLVRDGKPMTVETHLGRRDTTRESGGVLDARLQGAELSTVPAGSEPSGVVITDLNPRSPAYAAGLRKGDVITGVDHQPIRSVDDLKSAVRDAEGPLLVNAARGSTELFLVLR
jgi:serine protease Do/serine protease DegQ